MNLLMYLFYPIVILLIFAYFFFVNNQTKLIFNKHFRFVFISTIVVFCLGNLILFIYFKNEKFIYYWDYATFWEQSLKINNLISNNSVDAFKYLIQTMNYQEYTALPALFISLPTQIIGQSFFAFILSSYNFFVLPFYILVTIFELFLLNKLEINLNSNWILFLINILFIPFYFTLFHGYIGIVGQIFIVSLYLVFITKENDLKIPEVLLINSLSFLLIFTRRWYLFWVLSYYVGYGLFIILSNRNNFKVIVNNLFQLIKSGFIMLFVVLLFFLPYFLNLFNSNLSTVYASYKLSSYLEEFVRFKSYYGLFIIIISTYGLYISFRLKENILRFIFFVTVLTAVLFLSVQSFEYHHYNLVNFGIFIYFLIGILKISNRKYILFFLLLIYVISSIYVFIPKSELLNALFSSSKLKPKYRNDISEIQDLALLLNELSKENNYVYCAASSPFINDDLIRNAQLPWILNSVPNLEGSSNNDIRDGFPLAFFEVNFVLVTDPVQINLNYIDKQFVNQLINDSVLYKEEINNNYNLIYVKQISDVKVYIFERISNYTYDEKYYFYKNLKEMYPNNSSIYKDILK